MLVFFGLGNAKVLSFALGNAKLPDGSSFASQWNIGLTHLAKYLQHYAFMSEQEKLKTILNLKPLCKKEVKEDVCQTICTFVKKSYTILQ